MNVCEINRFVDAAGAIALDNYQFNPKTEKITISKGSQTVVIDLTISVDDQLAEFQLFLDGLIDS